MLAWILKMILNLVKIEASLSGDIVKLKFQLGGKTVIDKEVDIVPGA